jgi:hypothetical protein
MLEEPENNRLDQSLRDAFDDYELTPSAPVWKGIEQRLGQLPPPVLPRRRRRLVPLPLLFGLVALLAGLGGWLLPHGGPAGAPSKVASWQPVGGSAGPVRSAEGLVEGSEAPIRGSEGRVEGSEASIDGSEGLVKGSEAPIGRPERLDGRLNGPGRSSAGLVAGSKSSIKTSATPAGGATASVGRGPGRAGAPAAGSLAAASVAAGVSRPVPAGPGAAATPQPQPAAPAVVAMAAGSNEQSTPAVLRPLLALETTYAAQPKPSLTDPATATRAAVVATLRAERAELLRLQRRTDSLLLALGDVPLAAPLAAQPDTAAARPEVPKPDALGRRWSLLLTAAPEQNTVTLQGRSDDKLSALRQGHETGRSGFSAALSAEYKATPRLSVGGGLGYTQFGTEFRLTNRRTEVDVTYNTTATIDTIVGTSTYTTYSVRFTEVPVLSPHYNPSGQVLYYDTTYSVRPDTTFTTNVLSDTLRNATYVTTPVLTKREVLSTQTFRPQYRFLTLPLQLRYRITPLGSSRWWTDVALGAQLQFFLGGTQAVTSDGETYRTEKITAGNGPFRPLNLALSGSLALNYALTNRLSVSVAPSLRWQALSVYKAETGLRQQSTATGVQLGVRWAL